MTDNCHELRQVLREKWINTVLLLCVFHILQQVWRWIYEKSHGIKPTDRVELMSFFKSLLYSKDEETLEEKILLIEENTTIQVMIFVKYVGLLIDL